MREEIIGEHRRAPEEKVLNGGIAGWFVTLFARPMNVRVALDRFAKVERRRCYRGKNGSGGGVRAFYAKERQGRLSCGGGRPNGYG